MRILKLPDLPEFKRFPTLGPSGRKNENINGRAAAIECYLDLNWKIQDLPLIRWTSYNRDLDRYQGELVKKETYIRKFLRLRRKEPGYDFSRLTAVLELLIRTGFKNTSA